MFFPGVGRLPFLKSVSVFSDDECRSSTSVSLSLSPMSSELWAESHSDDEYPDAESSLEFELLDDPDDDEASEFVSESESEPDDESESLELDAEPLDEDDLFEIRTK